LPGRRVRTRSAQGLAVLFTLVCWTALFGLSDLADGLSGFVDDGRNTALDVGWGILFGVVVPVGLLAQLRSRSRVAGVHVLLIAGVSLAACGPAGEAWGYLVLGSTTIALAALFVALGGERSAVLRRRAPVRSVLLLLGAAAAVPAGLYAVRMSSNARSRLPPADAVSLGIPHWPALAALASTVVLLTVAAGLGVGGRLLLGGLAGLTACLWGLSCLLYPGVAGSEGRGWAAAAIGWAGITLGTVAFERQRDRMQPAPAIDPA
jgi:hypothetical protein